MSKSRFLYQLYRNNRLYFLLFALFLGVGIIMLAFIKKGDIIFFFSDHRSPTGNLFFFYFTKMGEELVFVAALLFFLFYKFRYAVFLFALAFLVTFTSFITKMIFAHDRPFLYFRKVGLFDQINVVDGVILNGGTNSFPSGHTMAAFALYTFLALSLSAKRGLAVLLFFSALLVGISRIYLVQHFLEDVYLGAIFGFLLAVLAFYLQGFLSEKPDHWGNKSLRDVYKNKTPSRVSKP